MGPSEGYKMDERRAYDHALSMQSPATIRELHRLWWPHRHRTPTAHMLCRWYQRLMRAGEARQVTAAPSTADESQESEGTMEYLYRYIDEMRCGCAMTEWGGEEYYTTGPHLRMTRYPVIKRTPCGAWISTAGFLGNGSFCSSCKRFVNLKATKRFACETEEEALRSFMARKQRQMSILTRQLSQAKSAMLLAGQLLPTLATPANGG